MTAFLLVECIALVLLFVCSSFFSSAETALFSLNPVQVHRLRSKYPVAGEHIERMLATPTQLLSTILIGNTVVNIVVAVLGFAVADRLWPSYGEAIAIPAMTLLLLLFGEMTPKRVAMSRAETMAALYAPVLIFLIRVMTPVRWALEHVAGLFTKDLHAARRSLTEDEFLTVVEVGEEEGVLDEEEATMVDGIISLEEMQASDVMTPRVDLVGIDLDDSPTEQERIARSVQLRYLPIYRGDLDNIEGLLDVLRFLLAEDRNLEAAQIPPFFVPETAPLDVILTSFQQENKRVAIVVDEYGGTAGLVTRGDVLEEIVDDVESEHTEKILTMQKVGDRSWLVDGSTSLEDVNDELELELDAEGADRIAGWVCAQAEHVPCHDEVVEAQGCRATVKRVRRNRIMLVLIDVLEKEGDEEEESDL